VPEGDTLVMTARRLRPALAGKPLVALTVRANRYPLPPAGSDVESVEARGKHLLVTFSDGTVLQSHLGMTGNWHLYRRGQRWRDEPGAARATIVVPQHEAVLFRAPTARLWPARLPGARPWEDLGPDLCRPPVDLDAIERRVDALPADTEAGEMLLHQQVAAGIGNVYKSETLFACGVHPFDPVSDLDGATVRRLYATASALLVANLGPGRRRTHGSGLAVYGRGGRDCPRCHATILSTRRGELGRVSYWCPRCQPRRHRADSQWAAAGP
jgi:endonuclease VIII